MKVHPSHVSWLKGFEKLPPLFGCTSKNTCRHAELMTQKYNEIHRCQGDRVVVSEGARVEYRGV